MDRIEDEMALMLGRINGVHAACVVIARHLPAAVAAAAAQDMRRASEAVTADALALPIADLTRHEMERVMLEVAMILESAAHQNP